MASAGNTPPLETPIEGLLATPTSRLPYQHNVLLRSYVLARPQGNLIVYNSPGVSESAAAIRALGQPARLLVNHSHESMYGQPDLDVPVWVHEQDRSEVTSLGVAGTFDGRGMIDDDLEVIPTPGHTAGTTSFLWDNGTHRFLFTGDFIWIENGEWKAVVLSPGLRRALPRQPRTCPQSRLRRARPLGHDRARPVVRTRGGSVGAALPRRRDHRPGQGRKRPLTRR